jgi:hypothetical protein
MSVVKWAERYLNPYYISNLMMEMSYARASTSHFYEGFS